MTVNIIDFINDSFIRLNTFNRLIVIKIKIMRTFHDSMFSHLSQVQIATRIMNQNYNCEALKLNK